MRIEWGLLAEGIGQDSRGVVTAIGINQNVVLGQTLPAVTKRAFIIHIVGDDLPDEIDVQFSFDLISPEGEIRNLASGTMQGAGGKPFQDLPASFDIPGQFLLELPSLGTYQIRATVVGLSDGAELQHSTELYVMKSH